MKPVALLALLGFSSLQTVSLTDCPCAALCETKNACPDEDRHEAPDDCCSRNSVPGSTAGRCFHLEPQNDLDAGMTTLGLDSVDGGPLPEPSAPGRASFAVVPPEADASPPARGRPLYQLQSSRLL